MLIEELKKASEYVENKLPGELHIIKNVLDEKIDKETKNEIHRKLSQYRNLRRELEELKNKYSNLEMRATKSTASGDGMPHASRTSDKVGDNASKMAELMTQISSNIKIVDNNILEIEKFVYDIEDSEIREIIRYRFIDGLNWKQVAFKMNGWNEATPRNRYNRWIRNL